MTPEQKVLARFALGLPNERRRTYRNSFVADPGGYSFRVWMGMVGAGFAVRGGAPKTWLAGSDLFHLTDAGAEAALEPDESLDPEDFQT